MPPSVRSNLTVNLAVLVFVISKTKTPTKKISKISTKSNYDRLKTIIRKTKITITRVLIYDPLTI